MMTSGRATTESGYAAVARQLAGQALSVAIDAAPHRPREGERRWSMAQALPAARVLIGEAGDALFAQVTQAAASLADTLADPAGKVADGFGHSRPVYAWFAVHLMGAAVSRIGDRRILDRVSEAARSLMSDQHAVDDDPRLGVWRRLVARQHGIEHAELMPLPAEEPSPLAPLGIDDLIDSWTYRELVGLHGLHLCSLAEDDESLTKRVESAALYHLGHTQPDYTTYQPWGLAAFASNPQTAVFAEQQLHDVATHLSIEGPGGAVLPALLLADAVCTMARPASAD